MTKFSEPIMGKPTTKRRTGRQAAPPLYPWDDMKPGFYIECALSEDDIAQYERNYIPKFISQGRNYFAKEHPEVKFSAHRVENDKIVMWIELRPDSKEPTSMDLDTRRAILGKNAR